ncbi:MAG: hypothetical protein RL757_2396 [Bacteroidota bacterium]|jgi:hypothetical protein
MIKDDRVALNRRFVRVFDMLSERGEIVKNDRHGKGVGDVAERVLGNKAYGHIIRAYLDPKSKRVIDYGQARQFCRAYNISEDYMINAIGTPFIVDSQAEMLKLYGVDNIGTGNIALTSVEALASGSFAADSAFGTSANENQTMFSLPGVAGNGLVAFPISGNSMEPLLAHGDIIVCRPLSGPGEIKENEIYAVRANGSVWVKYVQVIKASKSARVSHLKLISANYLEHDPFTEEVNDTMQVFKVIRRITQF